MRINYRRVLFILLDLEIFVTGGLTALSVASERFLPAAVLGMVFYWLIRWIATGKLFRRTGLDLPVLGLCIMIPVTLWATSLPAVTFPQVLRLLTGIGLYYSVVAWVQNISRLRWLTRGVGAALIGLVGMGLFFVDWDPTKFPFVPGWLFASLPSLPGDRIHRAVMGGYLLLLMPLLIGLILFTWRELNQVERIGYPFLLLISGVILGLTLSRGAWLGFATTVVVLAFLRWSKGWWLFGLLGIIALGGASIVGWAKIIGLFNDSSAFSGITGRMEIYSRAIMMIRDFPYTGIGMGTFGPVMDNLYPLMSATPGQIPHAHNLILQLAVDLGVLGMISWLAAFVIVIFCAWKVYRLGLIDQNLLATGLGAGLLASQTGMMVQGLMDAVVWGMVRPAPLVWLVWGMAVASWELFCVKKTRSEE